MTFFKTWEEFEKIAENVYLQNSMNTRFVLKYDHLQQSLIIKLTDNTLCLQYKAEMTDEIKKLEKFVSKLLNHMIHLNCGKDGKDNLKS
ncbi:hypothetical protein PGB90_008200 [Kerria lacca]